MYDDAFFEELHECARPTALVVVPIIIDLLRPSSVVDVGCGIGSWLEIFLYRGVKDVIGLDGGYAMNALRIPPSLFIPTDLQRPFQLNRVFDLAVSLEVAEHLPESSAESFIRCLTACSDLVLFSAAIPGQGGRAHVNEQWPAYWSKLFGQCGYTCYDFLRDQLRTRSDVAWWYAQNLLLFVNDDLGDRWEFLPGRVASGEFPRSLVHPECVLQS